MTAPPIPMPNVNINPQFVETNKQGSGLAMLLQALQHRQELDISKEKLRREWEQFELNKKLAGPQLEGMELDNERKKRELQAKEDAIIARDQALQIYQGNLFRLDDAKGVGEVIAQIKDGGVAEHFYEFLKTGLATQQQQRSLQPNYQFREAAGLGGSEIVGFDPQNPTQPVRTGVPGAPVQPQRPTDEMGKVGNYGVRVLENNATMTGLERRFPGIGQRVDAKVSNVRSVEQYPGIGRALATKALRLAVRGMTPSERLYWNARTDIGNALLRRASGAQINMEELDRETTPYVPISGEDESVVTSKQVRRLQQGLIFVNQAGGAFDPNSLSPAARQYLSPPSADGTVTPRPPRQRRSENIYPSP